MAQRGPATPLLPIRPVTTHTLSPSPRSVRMHVASLANRLTRPGSSIFPAVTPAPLLRSAVPRPAARYPVDHPSSAGPTGQPPAHTLLPEDSPPEPRDRATAIAVIRFLRCDACDLCATPAPGMHAKMLGHALIGARTPCNPTLATPLPPLHPSATPAPSAPEPNHCAAVIPPLRRTGAPAKQRIGSASTPGTSLSPLPSALTSAANLPQAPPSTNRRSSPLNSLHRRPARFRASVSTS
jgi:hypothetical protein